MLRLLHPPHLPRSRPLRPPHPLSHRTFILPSLPSLSSASQPSEQTFHERKILPYDRKQLYDLVADVGSYHRFIPYCIASRVLSGPTPIRGQGGEGEETESEAELTVGFMGLEERYVSRVVCRPYERVTATATSQIPLFKSLTTTWTFAPASPLSPHPTLSPSPPAFPTTTTPSAPTPTLLSIDLAYSFSNPLHAAVASAFFEKVSGKMIEAFERRCLEVYGPGKR